MNFYIQLGNENKITDVIQYPYIGYIEVELQTPLPEGIGAGIYSFNNGELKYRSEWDIRNTINYNSVIDDIIVLNNSVSSLIFENSVKRYYISNDVEELNISLWQEGLYPEWSNPSYFQEMTMIVKLSSGVNPTIKYPSFINWTNGVPILNAGGTYIIKVVAVSLPEEEVINNWSAIGTCEEIFTLSE